MVRPWRIWMLALVATASQELEKLNQLLEVAETIHAAFTNRYDVHLAELTVTEGRICATQTPVSVISRQFFEASWTTTESLSGSVEAMFNAQDRCFMKYAGLCETYAACADPLNSFDSSLVPTEGLFWAGNHTQVRAWQLEQLALLDQLAAAAVDSELSEKLPSDLASAAGFADLALSGMRSILQDRVSSLTHLVQPSTALAPQGGAAALPASLLALATDLSNLLTSAPILAANCGSGWLSGPAQDLAQELDSQDGVISLMDVGNVMQLSAFDYLRRALEALLSGASLALEVAAFAALSEFNCNMKFSPLTATVSAVDIVQDAVNGVLVKLKAALPAPSGQDASMPLRRCLAERVEDAEDRLPQASSLLVVASVPLLSLDFCGRLFNVTARELLSVVPYTGDLPFTSPTELFAASGEQRHVYLDVGKGLSFVGPFASYVSRSSSDTVTFTAGDQVIQLQAVQEMTLRAAKALPQENQCSSAQKLEISFAHRTQAGENPCGYAYCSESCPLGCKRLYSCDYGFCEMASPGFWGDGETHQACDLVTGNYYFYAWQWPNSSCPFLCEEADDRPVGRSCQSEVGYWSPVCNNTWHACDLPTGISASQFSSVANFTTTGRGAADGCEITLAFVAAKPPAQSFAVAALAPPFTVEAFVNMTLDAIPTGESSVSSMAVLFGSFPSWYLALRRVSAGQAQLVFYHSRLTLASHISAEDSTISSSSFSWDNAREPWRHVAVTVTQNVAFRHNIFFYVDGTFISSGYRSVAAMDILEAPYIIPEHRDVFHVGPVNMKRFPEVLSSGRPYYDLAMYTAQLDEVRVHQEALDTLTLGFQITELRRLAACNTPYEQRDGSACHARPRLTPPNTTLEQTQCRAGYEQCHQMPGICMEECTGNLLRQEDCSCDCAPSYFQTWLISAVHLTGSGDVKNATVYDADHHILGQLGYVTLPRRIALAEAAQVAVVEVWGGASATSVSLEVETPAPESLRLAVPELRSVLLQADRPALLHHRLALDYDDPTLSCARCPGEAPRSVLPRSDTMSCRCASGYGANLLGKCVPAGGPLQAPVISLANGTYHTAGTRVRMSFPPQDVEGPWLLAIRYEYGSLPDAPNCDTSPKYEELQGDVPGLDIIRRQESVKLRAVLCHPLHQISLESVVELHGNDHMNPPRCVASGNLSTETTYALQVQVELLVDQQPDASIFYELEGSSSPVTYTAPFVLTTPGLVTISSWAEKPGFDPSSRTSCSYWIDGAARLTLRATWPEPSPLLGFSSTEGAFLVERDLETLAFLLEVPGVTDTSSLQLQYRLWRGLLGVGSWQAVPSGGAMHRKLSDHLEAANTTTLLQVDWRLKEPGYVWTNPGYVRVLIIKTRTEVPSIHAEPLVLWQLGDHWFEGPKRDVAMRQTHTVQLLQPNPAARVLFSIRSEVGQPEVGDGALLTMSHENFTSLTSAGAMLEHFRSSVPNAGLQPEEMPNACGGTALQLLAVEVPKLCDYLGPFEVLGGAVVTAYAIVAGQLESPAATLLVPKELEPSVEDLTFRAFPEVSGNVLTITPQLQVLPSVSSFLSFSVGQPDAERQSCVLATPYSYLSTINSSKFIKDCSWLPYNGPRKLYLETLLQEAPAAALTLNVTILTTVRRPGYLWSFPLASTVLWLRERTPLPKVVQILEPGAVMPKAMVWLQEGQAAECFFTLHYEPLELSDVPSPFLVEVPAVTASVASIEEAFRPTAYRTALHGPDMWSSDVELCAWPHACELPMNGTLPVQLITVPAGYTRLCAWALWQGYLESTPACELMGASGTTAVAEPSFVPSQADLESFQDETVILPEEAGTDVTLRAQLLRPRSTSSDASGSALPIDSRRLSTATSMPLFLPRTHPLQYRYAVAAMDVKLLMQPGITQNSLTATLQFSAWTDLGLAAPTPLLQLPRRSSSDHVFFVVDVRLLTGVNRWSAETRSAALLLIGTESSPSVVHVGRSLLVDTAAGGGNSTLYFKWLQGTITSSFGADLLQAQSEVTHLSEAFQVHPAATLHDASDTSRCLVSDSNDLVSQKQFCTSLGPLTLDIPTSQRWSLWVTAGSDGLAAADARLVTVERPCAAPQDVAYARTISCMEGSLIESGTACSTICQEGYSPTVAQLQCSQGQLSPPQFACAEDSCSAPPNVNYSASSACLEGNDVAPGGVCTAQCEAGYAPSVQSLGCSRGRLTPSSFSCQEASCQAPEVLHAASPACSGLPQIKSRETCTPLCQDGYVASQTLLHCTRGQLNPETFVCEPGVTVDPSIIIASVPSTLLAGSLALMAAYCFRGPAKIEEKEASDPLKEWWQCVKEVEPGLCVFCGKEPEELETRYEDHGPPTLFRSCSSCAAILGFELEEEEDQQEEQEEELQVQVDEGGSNGQPDEASASAAASAASASGGSEGNMRLSRPPTFTDLRSSKGSISDAVRGLELEKFLTRDEDASQAPSDILPPAPPPDIAMPSRRPDVAASASTTPWPERRRLDSPAEGDRSSERSSFPPSSALHIRTTGGEGGPHEPFRNERSRRERMSLADWQDSPDERPRSSRPEWEGETLGGRPSGTLQGRRARGERESRRDTPEMERPEPRGDRNDERDVRRRLSKQERRSKATEDGSFRSSRRTSEEMRRSRRDLASQDSSHPRSARSSRAFQEEKFEKGHSSRPSRQRTASQM